MPKEFRENIEQLLAAEKMRVDRYVPDDAEIVRATSTIDVVKMLEAVGAATVLAGGYGLDALYGKLTREHGDADLLSRASDRDLIQSTLEKEGFQRVQESDVKDVYVHPSNPKFKIEVGFDEALRLFGETDISVFMPERSNARLLENDVRAMPIDGQIKVGQMQNQRAKEGGWGAYSPQKEIAREFLVKELLKRKGS